TSGSHGMRHRRWTRLGARDLHEELVGARDRLEQMARVAVREVACPFGSYDRRVLRALRDSSYERIYTSDEGPALAGSWIQPRNTIVRNHNLSQLEIIASFVPAGYSITGTAIKRDRQCCH